jgi:hypothetical protein
MKEKELLPSKFIAFHKLNLLLLIGGNTHFSLPEVFTAVCAILHASLANSEMFSSVPSTARLWNLARIL